MIRKIENPVVPWSGRGHGYTDEEVELVARVMRTADPLIQGLYQREFEARFRDYVGGRAAFAVATCSAALQLSAVLTRVGAGDEVIVPAHTFAATAIPFAGTGAKLVWADIDPDTRVMTAESIRARITPRTRVVVVVHLYGLMADMRPIMELAAEHNLIVVEDAAQSIGATCDGRPAGSFGDLACFSFHTHKNMTTLGEGGMLVVNREEWIDSVPGFRHYGMRAFGPDRERYWVPAMGNVDFDWDGVWPYNFCIGEVQCALGTLLLDRVDAMNQLRRSRAGRIQEALRAYPELQFQTVPEGRTSVWHLLAARYDGDRFGRTRDNLMELMAFTHKVQVVVQYYPLNRYPMFEKAGLGVADCPNTDRFFDNMVSFPFNHHLSEAQIDYMINAIRSSLETLRGEMA